VQIYLFHKIFKVIQVHIQVQADIKDCSRRCKLQMTTAHVILAGFIENEIPDRQSQVITSSLTFANLCTVHHMNLSFIYKGLLCRIRYKARFRIYRVIKYSKLEAQHVINACKKQEVAGCCLPRSKVPK